GLPRSTLSRALSAAACGGDSRERAAGRPTRDRSMLECHGAGVYGLVEGMGAAVGELTRRTVLFLIVASVAAAGEPNRLTDAERQQGWRLLFDGATTAGWEEITGKPFPANCWTVEDGSLKALVRTDGFQDIRTKEAFHGFELQFEWKLLKGGNSGVKYLIE